MTLNNQSILLIGGGKMAQAIIAGLLKKHLVNQNQITVVEPIENVRKHLLSHFKVAVHESIPDTLSQSAVIILAVKPHIIPDISRKLVTCLNKQPVVSIAAGMKVKTIQRHLNQYPNVVRVMPNTPASIGEGVSGLYATININDQTKQLIEKIMTSIGTCHWLSTEDQLDMITAISGSGPAYVLYLINALSKAAEQLGLESNMAQNLATNTFLGATLLAKEGSEDCHTLQRNVMSKGGTTEAAISYMNEHHLDKILMKACEKAYDRSKEIANELEQQS